LRLRHKTILITGAARGLGRELALLLDGEGCSLLLIDRDAASLSLLARELTREHQVIICDLSDLRERKSLIEKVNADILINCAGIGSHSQLNQLSADEIERVMQVNTLAPLELIAGLSPLELIAGLSPLELIVNIGSVAGEMNLPSMSLYAASKSALHVFTRSIQLEVARTLLVILGPLRGTDFAQSIAYPRTGQPQWYRGLDLDAKYAAREIIRAMKRGQSEIVLPRWYPVVFVLARWLAPLIKFFGKIFS
jgi:short-subunit dehydrogenase